MTPTAKECAIHGVTEEIKYFISITGIGFHPDTDFCDYIDKHTKQKWFIQREAARLNKRLDECHAMCEKYDIDIYEISHTIMKPELEKAFKNI